MSSSSFQRISLHDSLILTFFETVNVKRHYVHYMVITVASAIEYNENLRNGTTLYTKEIHMYITYTIYFVNIVNLSRFNQQKGQ